MKSIQPNMKLTKGFLRNVYAWEMDYPGFAEQAIVALEGVGCSRAREHYLNWVNEYEMIHEAEMREAAAWYVAECEKEWKKKAGDRQRDPKNSDFTMKRREKLTELIEKLESH